MEKKKCQGCRCHRELGQFDYNEKKHKTCAICKSNRDKLKKHNVSADAKHNAFEAPCNTPVALHPSREIPKWIKRHSTAKSHLIWSWVMVDIRDHHSPTNERSYSYTS